MEPRHKRGVAIAALVLLACLATYFVVRTGSDRPPPPAARSPPPASTQAADPAPAPTATVPATEEPAPEASASAVAEAPAEDGTAVGASKRGDGAPKRDDRDRAKTAPKATAEAKAREAPDAGAPAQDAGAPAATAAAKKADDAMMVGYFTNRAGKEFRLLRVSVLLDGQPVYSGAGGPAVEIFRRASTPGDHTLTVHAEYQGNGGGVFSYFDGYKFTVRGNRSFAAKPEGRTQVSIAVMERGGKLTPHDQRLGLAISVN
jgi:hypothetical protein